MRVKRTTIALDDDLFRRIKQEAARQGETLRSFLNSFLRKALNPPKATKPYKLKWKPIKGGLKPGVDVSNRETLYEIMEGRR